MLAVDQVERARSGHPGLPLGAAPMAYVLWTRFLKHNPKNPFWIDRDRFVLSAGHGSALLYALLHLTGYDMPMEELMRFRQWGSATPGHPEYDLARGIEATTGPLGQGFGMAVGMAIAERVMSQRFSSYEQNIISHYTYTIVSDGDLMEGVTSEAASLAGHLKLGKFIALYDDNHISIEGNTALAFTEDRCRRFEAYGWQVIRVEDGNDIGSIDTAIRAARKNLERPSFISIRTHIGFGSPRQDDAVVHGEPLGAEGVHATKRFYGWPEDKNFFVPDDVAAFMRQAIERGQKEETSWRERFECFRAKHPEGAPAFEEWQTNKLPKGWDANIPNFAADELVATREASGKVMSAFAARLENFIGGSGDLAPSTKTYLSGFGDVGTHNDAPRNIHFGVREHAMGTIVNGMALHGGIIPFGATFLIFSDYMRPAIRIASLMNTHSIFIFTHDSVGLGEDGPTHQPVEHLMSLRAMPRLTVIRPADANETAEAWRVAIERIGPVALILTRQKVPVLDRGLYLIERGVKRGAYVISDSDAPELIIIATGSEVHLALAAKEKLLLKGIQVRVVSMPSWEIFDEQPQEYRDEVLPPNIVKRISIEAGATLGWQRWVGDSGIAIGIDRFGASAPGEVVMEKLGLTVDAIVEQALNSYILCKPQP